MYEARDVSTQRREPRLPAQGLKDEDLSESEPENVMYVCVCVCLCTYLCVCLCACVHFKTSLVSSRN